MAFEDKKIVLELDFLFLIIHFVFLMNEKNKFPDVVHLEVNSSNYNNIKNLLNRHKRRSHLHFFMSLSKS